MTDDEGVLGNLPRSRPGRRSDKRTAKTSAAAAEKAERSQSPAARSAAGSEPRNRARVKPAAPGRRAAGAAAGESIPGSAEAARRTDDPVGGAIRVVAGVAVTGARVANGVAREVLRRLPRP